jgi:hypothetical protein
MRYRHRRGTTPNGPHLDGPGQPLSDRDRHGRPRTASAFGNRRMPPEACATPPAYRGRSREAGRGTGTGARAPRRPDRPTACGPPYGRRASGGLGADAPADAGNAALRRAALSLSPVTAAERFWREGRAGARVRSRASGLGRSARVWEPRRPARPWRPAPVARKGQARLRHEAAPSKPTGRVRRPLTRLPRRPRHGAPVPAEIGLLTPGPVRAILPVQSLPPPRLRHETGGRAWLEGKCGPGPPPSSLRHEGERPRPARPYRSANILSLSSSE